MTECEHCNHDGYYRLPKVLELFPVGKSTWWDGVKRGIYPKPIKLSPRVTAWKKIDIVQVLRNPPVRAE